MVRRRYKRHRRPKGKKLEGFERALFAYPRARFIALVLWTAIVLVAAVIYSLSLPAPWYAATAPLALLAAIITGQAWYDRHLLHRQTTIEQLRRISPAAFEHYTARLLGRHGYSACKVSGGAGDRGADVTARRGNKAVVVQCKRYAAHNKVTSPEMQKFVGTVKITGAGLGLYITTSSFTSEAKAIANDTGIILIDAVKLSKMIRNRPHDH